MYSISFVKITNWIEYMNYYLQTQHLRVAKVLCICCFFNHRYIIQLVFAVQKYDNMLTLFFDFIDLLCMERNGAKSGEAKINLEERNKSEAKLWIRNAPNPWPERALMVVCVGSSGLDEWISHRQRRQRFQINPKTQHIRSHCISIAFLEEFELVLSRTNKVERQIICQHAHWTRWEADWSFMSAVQARMNGYHAANVGNDTKSIKRQADPK